MEGAGGEVGGREGGGGEEGEGRSRKCKSSRMNRTLKFALLGDVEEDSRF